LKRRIPDLSSHLADSLEPPQFELCSQLVVQLEAEIHTPAAFPPLLAAIRLLLLG
jgi:hypothetical protein